MVIGAEECGELTQVCMKYMRRYTDFEEVTKDMHDKLVEEAGDVLCMIELMIEHNLLTKEEIDIRIVEKRVKLKKWSNLVK
jgi:hypothetical protein